MTEKVLDALSEVVFSTYISSRNLARPPFSLLHKILVEVLGPLDLFESLGLKTKEDKATFLTRAIAWTHFVMNSKVVHPKPKLDVLLLVSPIKVLAGVEIESTHEFLYQLALAVKIDDTTKLRAVKKVKAIGDRELYTYGVKFRSGLVQAQARTRGWLVRKNQMSVVGKEFFKEFEGYGTFRGKVKSCIGNICRVHYPEDDDEEDIELHEVLELIKNSNETKEANNTADEWTPTEETQSPQPETRSPRTKESSWQERYRRILEKGKSDDEQEATRLKVVALQNSKMYVMHVKQASDS